MYQHSKPILTSSVYLLNHRNSNLLRQSTKQLNWKPAGSDVKPSERNTRVRLHLYTLRQFTPETPTLRHQEQIQIVPVQARLHRVSMLFFLVGDE